MKVVYTSVWLGHSGDITAASNYGSVSDDPLAKQYLGSYFFGTLATTGPGAADFVDLGEQYQYGFGGPINKPASEGSTGFTVGANTLIFAMEPTGFASGPPPDGFAPILTPASYDVSGSATIGGLSVDSGGIVTLTGAITSNGTASPGSASVLISRGTAAVTGVLTSASYGSVGALGTLDLSGNAYFGSGTIAGSTARTSLLVSAPDGSARVKVEADGILNTVGLMIGTPSTGGLTQGSGSVTVP